MQKKSARRGKTHGAIPLLTRRKALGIIRLAKKYNFYRKEYNK